MPGAELKTSYWLTLIFAFLMGLVLLNFIRTKYGSHSFMNVGKFRGIFLDSSSAAKILEGLDISAFGLDRNGLRMFLGCAQAPVTMRSSARLARV
jgi:hypothetical protein